MTTLQPLRRRAAAVSSSLLLALALTACGGGGSDAGGAPEDASTEDFCTTFAGFGDDLDEDDPAQAAEAANEIADELAEVGTPEDLGEEAREGFELFVEYLGEIDEGDVEDLENSESPEDIFDDGDADAITAFFTEASTICAGELEGQLEGELPE
jgi:hypothetical protein